MREIYVSKSSLSKKTREQRTNEDPSNVKPTNAQLFADIAPIGLKREKRTKTPSQMLSHPSEIKKRTKNKYYGLLLMATHSYHRSKIQYKKFTTLHHVVHTIVMMISWNKISMEPKIPLVY